MAGPQRVNSTPVTHRSYESNLQHVGGQRQVANRQTTGTPAEAEDRVQLGQDHVTLARDGAENAAHVGTLQSDAREADSEQLLLPAPRNQIAGLLPAPHDEVAGLLPAPENEIAGLLPAPQDEPKNLPVPYEQHLPVPVQGGDNLPVPVKAQLPAVQPGAGQVIDAEWEPVYPGTPDQGMSPYVPGGGAPPPGGPGGPGDPGGPVPPGGPSQADAARNFQQYQQEQQDVQRVWMQMAADRQKWMMEMWKILQDTQTKIYEIMESAILYRAQTNNKINQMWDDVIRGV